MIQSFRFAAIASAVASVMLVGDGCNKKGKPSAQVGKPGDQGAALGDMPRISLAHQGDLQGILQKLKQQHVAGADNSNLHSFLDHLIKGDSDTILRFCVYPFNHAFDNLNRNVIHTVSPFHPGYEASFLQTVEGQTPTNGETPNVDRSFRDDGTPQTERRGATRSFAASERSYPVDRPYGAPGTTYLGPPTFGASGPSSGMPGAALSDMDSIRIYLHADYLHACDPVRSYYSTIMTETKPCTSPDYFVQHFEASCKKRARVEHVLNVVSHANYCGANKAPTQPKTATSPTTSVQPQAKYLSDLVKYEVCLLLPSRLYK